MIQLESEAGTKVTASTTTAGHFTTATLSALTDPNSDGILELTFRDTGGNPVWTVLGLDIAEAGSLPGVMPLLAAGKASAAGNATPLTQTQLDGIVTAAIDLWAGAGLNAPQSAVLQNVQFQITDLGPSHTLALAGSRVIQIDDDAAGFGWFIDATPQQNEEFGQDGTALAGSIAQDHMDLLTAVTHELGHVLGLGDDASDSGDLMDALLPTGQRRLPSPDDVDAFFSNLFGASDHLPLLPFEGR